ncbi:hypothetical protein AOLI_G00054960 [Acnodon oligacanthus]
MDRDLERHLEGDLDRVLDRERRRRARPEANEELFSKLLLGVTVAVVGGATALVASGVRALWTKTPKREKKLDKEFPKSLETMKTAEVHEALKNLGSYSNTVDPNGQKLLDYLSNLSDKIFHWIKAANGAIICLNLVRYFHKMLTEAEVSEDVDLHIVLVGDGSISDQVRPADWLVPLNTITDTILYPPWNCAIDANVAYGISTGCMLPEHGVFRNGEPQGPLPERWNSMAAQQTTGVPEIILGPMRTDADWMMKLTALADWMALLKDRRRLIIPYPPGGVLADWLPAVPLDRIIAVIAFLLKILPPYKATVHLAAGLQHRGATPPDVEMWQDLYACTPDGTVMSTQDMERREYPMLYSILRSMFHSTRARFFSH